MAAPDRCPCPLCRSLSRHPDGQRHVQLRAVLARLDEQERRWVAALEAQRLGHGGLHLVSLISGLHENTLRRGERELAACLRSRPVERVRLPGAGRPLTEKKSQTSKPP